MLLYLPMIFLSYGLSRHSVTLCLPTQSKASSWLWKSKILISLFMALLTRYKKTVCRDLGCNKSYIYKLLSSMCARVHAHTHTCTHVYKWREALLHLHLTKKYIYILSSIFHPCTVVRDFRVSFRFCTIWGLCPGSSLWQRLWSICERSST